MPRGLRGRQEIILDTHELTAEAVVRGDYNLLRQAIMTDPLVTSIADADAILAAILDLEKDAIPQSWYA
jgi:alpha-galactosidase